MLEQVLARMQDTKSFDIVRRNVVIGGKKATILFIDGLIKDEVFAKMMDFFFKITPDEMQRVHTPQDFCDRFVPYVEVTVKNDLNGIVTDLLSGPAGLFFENFEECILIDTRTYPQRGIQEPEKDKVLRGSHEGFVETVVFNTAMIRRHIRDERLVMEISQIGKRSHTDVVLCYLDHKVDKQLLSTIQQKLKALSVNSLSMTMQSLAEALVKNKWINPFPKVRYTERPDVAAASVQEGKVILLIDNTPCAMILPTAFFDFFEQAGEYYFPPFTGTYMHLMRMFTFLSTLILIPLWQLYLNHADQLPQWLSFLNIAEPNSVPIWVQLILLEIAVDVLRLASANTPDMLGSSLSIVGALLLGEFAVKTGIFVPDTILFSAFTALAAYTQTNFELGYAFKYNRILLILLTAAFDWIGFVVGLIFVCIEIGCTKDVAGNSYLYPLIPFNGADLKRKFIREKMNHKNS